VLYALAPLAVTAACIVIGRRPLALLVILGYLMVEGFLKLLSNYNPVVHVGIDLIVLGYTGWLVLTAVAARRTGLRRIPWTGLILAYAAWIVVEVGNPYSAGLLPSMASFKVHLTMIPLYFLAAELFARPSDVRGFVVGVTLLSLVPFATALAQYALGPESVLDLSPRFWQNIAHFHEWRPFGTAATPGGSAAFAFLGAPFALAILTSPGYRRWHKVLAAVALALAGGTFVVSGGRQLFLGCVLALLAMTWLAVSRGRLGSTVALAVAAALGVGSYFAVERVLRPLATEAVRSDPRVPEIWRDNSVTNRLLTLADPQSVVAARQNPLKAIAWRLERYPLGAGLGRTGSAAGALQGALTADPQSARLQQDVGWSDNFFANMIVETGVPGVVLLSAILVAMLVTATRTAARSPDASLAAVAAAVAGVLLAVLAMSWGSQPLLANPITAWFWLTSGVVAAMGHMAPAGGSAAPADAREERVAAR
jgi:hypothetical protein